MLFVAVIIIFANCIPSYALESGVSEFTVTPIRPNFKDLYISINVKAPTTQKNSKMLVAFYVDGKLTRLTPLDISANNIFTSQRIYTYVEVIDSNGEQKNQDLTPDEIKIFTWDKTTLKPKTLCHNVLTPEVIAKANAEVVKSLEIVPEATAFIRDSHLTWEEDYLEGIADKWDTHLFPIMDYIDLCAKGALTDAETHLLTSPFAQNRYRDNLSQIRNLLNEAPAEQKNKLVELLDSTKLGKEYYKALNNAMKFMNFSLTEI